MAFLARKHPAYAELAGDQAPLPRRTPLSASFLLPKRLGDVAPSRDYESISDIEPIHEISLDNDSDPEENLPAGNEVAEMPSLLLLSAIFLSIFLPSLDRTIVSTVRGLCY